MRLLTEEEARETWCPEARMWSTAGINCSGGWNRHPPQAPADGNAAVGCNCIASKCAMWRWQETEEFRINAEREFAHTGQRLECDTGHCGLIRGTP